MCLFDFTLKKYKHCGKPIKDIITETLSEGCPNSPNKEHEF